MSCSSGDADTCNSNGNSNSNMKLQQQRAQPPSRPSRILFASCNSQNLTQPLWPIMQSRNAAAFVWAGDAIYADHFAGLDFTHFPPQPIHESATPDELRQYYAQQLSHPGYRSFLDSNNITVFGTIDDHDYGANNGDRTYKYRRESGIAHIDFTGEPPDSPIRMRAEAGKGVYGVKVFDFDRDVGDELVPDAQAGVDSDISVIDIEDMDGPRYSNKSVAVFVIDVRTNRSPWGKGLQAWRQSNEGDMLGEGQFVWLEHSLRRSKASVNIVVTGMQVHANRFPSSSVAEEWVKFPRSRQRLYEAILQNGVQAPIIVSGDVHMAQLLRKDCFRRELNDESAETIMQKPPRHLVELTSSGLTHSWGTCFASSERFHKSWYSPYYYFMSRASMTFNHMKAITPWTELVRTDPSTYATRGTTEELSADDILYENGGAEGSKMDMQYSLDLNFGELEFDWDHKKVSVRVFGVEGAEKSLLAASWSFNQLSGYRSMPGSNIGSNDVARVLSKQALNDEWVCVNYQGIAHPVHYFLTTLSGTVLLFSLILLPNILGLTLAFNVVRFLIRRTK